MKRASLFLLSYLLLAGVSPVARAASPPIIVIVEENHSYAQIVGDRADAPYINGTLIPGGRMFTNYDANMHESLFDYLTMTAGTTGSCTTKDCAPGSVGVDNLFNQLGGAGLTWLALDQSMPTACDPVNAKLYVVDHNPPPYFSDLQGGACTANDVPWSAPTGPLPAFTFITPDLCNDMHGTGPKEVCPGKTAAIIKAGDQWLSQQVPQLLALGAEVDVVWDEGVRTDTTGGGGHVLALEIGSNVTSGVTDSAAYSHDSLPAGLEIAFGLPLLAGANSAAVLPQ